MARQLLNTLYVMTPNSYLHLENDTLRVEVEREKKLQVPLHHLGSVVCLGNIMLSPALMHRCADDGISLVLLSSKYPPAKPVALRLLAPQRGLTAIGENHLSIYRSW